MKPYITILFIAIASLLALQATDASQESFDWKAALKEVDPSDFDNYQQYYVDLIANPYTYEVTCKSGERVIKHSCAAFGYDFENKNEVILIKSIEIYDSLGRIIKSEVSKTLNITELDKGIYFLKVKPASGGSIEKIIKE